MSRPIFRGKDTALNTNNKKGWDMTTISRPHSIQKNRQAFVFIGPPRVGKGTQCTRLGTIPGLALFITGDQLRELARRDPGNANYDPIRTGGLVTAAIVLEAFTQWERGTDTSHDLVLDGIPRDVKQMELLFPMLINSGVSIKVVEFTTPAEACLGRPVRENRLDDADPQTAMNRHRVYEMETLPMIAKLPEYGISVEGGDHLQIDNSNLQPHETAEQIIRFLQIPCEVKELFPEAFDVSRQGELTFAK